MTSCTRIFTLGTKLEFARAGRQAGRQTGSKRWSWKLEVNVVTRFVSFRFVLRTGGFSAPSSYGVHQLVITFSSLNCGCDEYTRLSPQNSCDDLVASRGPATSAYALMKETRRTLQSWSLRHSDTQVSNGRCCLSPSSLFSHHSAIRWSWYRNNLISVKQDVHYVTIVWWEEAGPGSWRWSLVVLFVL